MFVFIIDNAISSKAHLSGLDIIKHSIESFLLSIVRSEQSTNLQLMILQIGQDTDCLISSFGDPISLLEHNLKNIECRVYEPTPLDFSYPLSYALGVINTYRMKSGIDTFGHGRAPW